MKTIGEVLSSMDYPGRFFVIGRNVDLSFFALYGITGRSEKSQARRIFAKDISRNSFSKGLILQVEHT
ncbi:hypothetical protein J4455_01175 [Candidatus Woesearchaeota archaeon]|nr:hypothetical protein [Candidatus Woesearchaeota archaeon]